MKTLALIADPAIAHDQGLHTVEATVHGHQLPFAYIDMQRPQFQPNSKQHRDQVLIRVVAASCNYRDAGLLLRYHDMLQAAGGNRFVHFGSDFTGDIVAVGSEVTHLAEGTRVIPDATYPQDHHPSAQDGVPTNQATRGWLILPAHKVRAVPGHVDPHSASVLGLNAQTAASMIRKAGVSRGDRVLVTAGRSNTSLSVLAQLAALGVDATVLSTSPWTEAQRRVLGDPAVVDYEPDNVPFSTAPIPQLQRADEAHPGAGAGVFDAVIDPFFDLFMLRVLPHLAHGGTYVTCGLKNQHLGQLADEQEINHAVPVSELYGALSNVMVKNQRIVGNCIGLREDLTEVVSALSAGALTPVVDSVYPLAEARDFLNRSFHDRSRFGKVVLELEPA